MNEATNALLERIAAALEQLARASLPEEPNYRFQLSQYGRFDWSTIGAAVVASDRQGATAVSWNGHTFTRRAGVGKFGQAVWFSRPSGQDEEGTTYLRLVTFKDLAPAEPLPARVAESVGAQTNGRQRPSSPSTDWEQEAATADDALLFDTAACRLEPWYKDASAVAQFRDNIFGVWQPGQAAAYLAGLREYARRRQSGAAHNPAKVDALKAYNAQRQAAGRE